MLSTNYFIQIYNNYNTAFYREGHFVTNYAYSSDFTRHVFIFESWEVKREVQTYLFSHMNIMGKKFD